jgi:hypothetical protein
MHWPIPLNTDTRKRPRARVRVGIQRHRRAGDHSDGRRRRSGSWAAHKAVKFDRNLCRRCNNERSQPFDAAYTSFISFVAANERNALRARRADLAEVIGADWPNRPEDVRRYYVKHISCRLAEAGLGVPTQVIRYLDTGARMNWVSLGLVTSGEWALIAKGMARHVEPLQGPLVAYQLEGRRHSQTGELAGVSSGYQYR